MLWMERLALIFYVVINIFLFGFLYIICSLMEVKASANDIQQLFILGIAFTLPFWALFRVIDYLLAGPLRREIRRQNSHNTIDQYQFR